MNVRNPSNKNCECVLELKNYLPELYEDVVVFDVCVCILLNKYRFMTEVKSDGTLSSKEDELLVPLYNWVEKNVNVEVNWGDFGVWSNTPVIVIPICEDVLDLDRAKISATVFTDRESLYLYRDLMFNGLDVGRDAELSGLERCLISEYIMPIRSAS